MKYKTVSRIAKPSNLTDILSAIAQLLSPCNGTPELWLELALLVTWQWEHFSTLSPSAWHGCMRIEQNKLVFSSKVRLPQHHIPTLPKHPPNLCSGSHTVTSTIVKNCIWEISYIHATATDFTWQYPLQSGLGNALNGLLGEFQRLHRDIADLSNELALTNQGVITLMEEAMVLTEDTDQDVAQLLEERLTYNRELLSRLKQKEAELQHADRLATIGRMAAGVAHEINNPLTFIKINAELLARTALAADNPQLPAAGSNSERPIKAILHGVDRIANIVNGLKRFSRQEQKGKQAVELSQCLNSAWQLIASDQKLVQNIHLTCRVASTIQVYGNSQQLEQIFINLLHNSIHAIAKTNVPTGLITVATSTHDNWVTITVSDNGCGISPQDLTKIFEPFFTKTPGGTGLGLSVVHGLIAEHNGRITATSVLGSGTTFTIILPLGNQRKDEDDGQ